MKHNSRSTTPKYLQQLAGLAFALSLGGCSDDLSGPSSIGSGGVASADSSGQGGSSPAVTNSAATGGEQATGGVTSSGGAAQEITGGAAEVNTGGAAPVITGGAAPVNTGGAAEVSTGGAAQEITGGAAQVSTGGAAPAGTGGTTPVGPDTTAPNESLCFDEMGAAVPYDFTFGLMGEYAFELSMSCDVGGYLMPLVMADPEQLTQVNVFIADAADWYRAHILNCKDATAQLDKNSFGLLPVPQSSDLSDADFEASLALFSMVIDRHDGQPDSVSPDKKDKIKNRINSVKGKAVHGVAAGLTKTLTEPDCVPAAPEGNGG